MRFWLSFLLIFISFHGVAKTAESLTYKEALKESARAIVRKERSKALKILATALEDFKGKARQRAQLVTAIERAGALFISDRGQSVFESGRNLYLVSPAEALPKLNQALEIEGENTLVLWALTRTYLKLGQCEKARETFDRLNTWAQRGYQVAPLLFSYCEGKGYDQLSMETLPPQDKLMAMGLYQFEKEEYLKAESSFLELQKKDPNFIESYYWIWRSNPKNTEAASKYKKQCELDPLKLAKAYPDFPQLCKFSSQVAVKEEVDAY